jgi:hypothetical protein
MKLSFKFLKECTPGDLLRVKINDTAEFALVGAEVNGPCSLVVLKDSEPRFAINWMESGYVDGDFETYAALVYGKYEIRPDHSDRCEIGEGPLFTKSGALVYTQTLGGQSEHSESLVVRAQTGKSFRYFDLKDGKLGGERGGHKAAFKTWSLWHVADAAMPTRLLGYSVAPHDSVPGSGKPQERYSPIHEA